MWNNLIPHLIKRNRVICIDLLGHGKTECLGYVHSMDLMAETVNAVLKKIRIRRIKLIGHSMGGYVALAFCNTFPGKVKALCLMNSTSRADSDEKKTNRDRAIEAVKNTYKTFVRISVSNLFKPSNRLILTKEIEEVTKEALKTPLQGIVAALEGMKIRDDLSHLLSNKNIPIQMILGKKDPVLPLEDTLLQLKNTTAQHTVLPDGHMSHLENPELLLPILLAFCQKT